MAQPKYTRYVDYLLTAYHYTVKAKDLRPVRKVRRLDTVIHFLNEAKKEAERIGESRLISGTKRLVSYAKRRKSNLEDEIPSIGITITPAKAIRNKITYFIAEHFV